MSLLRVAVTFAMLTPVINRNDSEVNSSLVAHEWGTFTSVAGIDGTPVQWAPLIGAPDLPCFVDHLSPHNLKLALGLVRMETPVLYFYSPRALELSVEVQFPNGWITEWYPQANRIKPELSLTSRIDPPVGQGQIDWDSVQVKPGANSEFPANAGGSRYFAARNTDSAPLQIGQENEKFIFYRGMGNFAVPLEARFTSDGRLDIKNTGPEPIPLAIVFEKRGDRIGYRVAHYVQSLVQLDTPELTGRLDDLQQQIRKSLVAFGLYDKEAAAMIETWQDSWFEEGMRVLYIIPRATIDSVLPLRIDPAPAITARVFVGRVEVLSPAVRQALETALRTGDTEILSKFGRFLNPFLSELGLDNAALASSVANEYLQHAQMKIARDFYSTSCVQ